MTTRLKRRLETTKAEGRGILMGFLPAGYPSPDGFIASARAAFAASELEEPVIHLQSADLRTGGTFDPDKARERLTELAEALRAKPHHVCVGFGVRGRDEVETVIDAGADGAIIGTRFVQAAAGEVGHTAALVDEVMPALLRPDHMRA